MCCDPDGKAVVRAEAKEEGILLVTLPGVKPKPLSHLVDRRPELYNELVVASSLF